MLAINFADSQRYFAEALLEIHRAHLAMLAEQSILSGEHARILAGALRALDLEQLRAARFDGTCEDFFFYVEERIAAHCGPEIAGRLHTARSRNDVDITLYRMVLRKEVLGLLENVLALRDTLMGLAAAHLDTVMPAYTHTQPAQPTTLAHYLMAAVEFLERDAVRLQAAYRTVNRSPLGACAITTTGFAIDRRRTAALLGFDGLQTNSYGAIAAVDYILESVGTVATTMANVGKLVQDLLLWSMQEFRFLRLPDGFVQGSSIMPQKRNPVALEHARILASRAFAEAQAVMTSMHNTPFGDIVDSEDDLQPLVMTAFHDARRTLHLLAEALLHACFDTVRLAALAGRQFLTVTELADTLVRESKLSFRQAHGLVSKAVQAHPEDDTPDRIVDDLLRLAPGLAGRDALLAALDAGQFVARRLIPGGPARAAIEPELARARHAQADLAGWLEDRRTALEAAHRELAEWTAP
ncbi:MAG TPA: argininosuccinate lyase [Bryobacteraceae bacterium]|nr:argininosuccinate lyase [Bryobacteraceae bacterium]